MPTESYSEYLTPSLVPVMLPPVTYFRDAIKQELGYPGEPVGCGLSYMSSNRNHLPGIDISAGHPSPYDHMVNVSSSSSSRSPALCPSPSHLAYRGRARC